MEKILSKKLTLVVMILLAALGLNTAAQTVSIRPFTKTEWINGVPYQVTDMPGNNSKAKMFIKANEPQTPQPKKRNAKKEEAQMVNVNIQLVEHDDIAGYPSSIYAYSEDGNVDEYGGSSFALSVGENTLQAGVYTFKAVFYKLKSNNEPVDYYVFKESIPVLEDMTLTFDADEAKNFVQTKVIGSDGNEIQFMHEIVGQGLIGGECIMGGFTPFVKDGLGYTFGGTFDGAGVWCNYNFYISDIDDIALDFQIFFDKDDVIHTVSFYQKGVHEDVVFENDPNDYIEHEIEYKTTPLGVESDSPHYPIVMNASWDGAAYGKEIYRNVSDGKLKYRFGTSHFDPAFPVKYQMGLTDYAYFDDNMDEDVYKTTYTLPIFNIDGELRVVNSGIYSYGVSSFDYYELDGETLYLNGFPYPGHPAFSYPISQKYADVLNNNCPIMRIYPYVYLGDDFAMIAVSTYSLGRFGELRETDQKTITNIVKVDDNVSEMGADFIAFSQSANSGIIEATLTNENVGVDGISGKNVSQIYVDLAREDKAAPTLTMLHFRDNDGVITDRFVTSDIGNFELSAVDLYSYPNWEENTVHHSINRTINVEVSYSPYGEDNWNEIVVEEDPSLFFLPDMGNFFHGSLEGVTGQAYEGWFDLKVKVTDAAGNWQEQVISPAFRIDNLAYSGVATPRSDNAREVARYNLAGQRIDQNAKGIVIVKMSDGTARKILVP